MKVMVEFKLKGHLVRAKLRVESVDEAVKEIQVTHPGCEIISASRGTDDIKEKKTIRRPRNY